MGKLRVHKVVSMAGGTTVVMVSPLVMLPDTSGALLASAMATGVVMVFAGLAHDLLPGRSATEGAAGSVAGAKGEQ